jgi:hypothetical protein
MEVRSQKLGVLMRLTDFHSVFRQPRQGMSDFSGPAGSVS